jgi:uncharacterized membrane protein
MQPEQGPGSVRRQTVLYRRIVGVMNAGFLIAIGLMLAGLLVGLITGEHVERDTDRLRDVLPGVLQMQAQDIVELGILVLIATPAAYIVVALFTFMRNRDGFFVMVCLALLGLLSLSVGLTVR